LGGFFIGYGGEDENPPVRLASTARWTRKARSAQRMAGSP